MTFEKYMVFVVLAALALGVLLIWIERQGRPKTLKRRFTR